MSNIYQVTTHWSLVEECYYELKRATYYDFQWDYALRRSVMCQGFTYSLNPLHFRGDITTSIKQSISHVCTKDVSHDLHVSQRMLIRTQNSRPRIPYLSIWAFRTLSWRSIWFQDFSVLCFSTWDRQFRVTYFSRFSDPASQLLIDSCITNRDKNTIKSS